MILSLVIALAALIQLRWRVQRVGRVRQQLRAHAFRATISQTLYRGTLPISPDEILQ